MNENFSTKRYWLLLRSTAVGGYRQLITMTATLAGVIAVLAFLNNKSGDSFYTGLFGWILIVLGLILSSRGFLSLHDKTRNTLYLLTPASSLEKTLVPLLLFTIGFFVYLLVLFSVVSMVVEPLNYWVFGQSRAWFNPFDPALWKKLPDYLFLQSFYFLGAAWFRTAHFVKTTFSLLLTSVVITVFSLVVLRILFAPYWQATTDVSINFQGVFESFSGGVKALVYSIGVLWVFMCWYVVWLRVRETQVCDGV